MYMLSLNNKIVLLEHLYLSTSFKNITQCTKQQILIDHCPYQSRPSLVALIIQSKDTFLR